MTEDLRQEVVTTYLKQLRLNRMARDCTSAAREAEQRGLGYLGYLQGLKDRRTGSTTRAAVAPTTQGRRVSLPEAPGGFRLLAGSQRF